MRKFIAMFLMMLPWVASAQMNDYGVQFMRQAVLFEAAQGQSGKNIMTSPAALYYAMSMALNGTSGATQAEFLRSLNLRVQGSVEDINQQNAICHKQLSNARDTSDRWAPPVPIVNISNGAWHTTQRRPDGGPVFQFSPEYTSRLQQFYGAEIGAVDFKDPASAGTFNNWAERKTNGLIKTILTPDEIRELIFILINATYFEGAWENPFHLIRDPAQSQFTLANGSQKQVQMMRNQDYYRYLKTATDEIIALPFVSPQGKRYVTYIVLPRTEQKALAAYWDQRFWSQTMTDLKQATQTYGEIIMPKFAFNYDVKLTQESELTQALNLGFLFANSADFSAMKTPDSEPAKVGLIKQVTRLEFGENGVKAAAVVVVGGMRATSIGRDPIPEFHMRVNKGFVMAIAEESSEQLLFLGQVVNPEL